MNNLAMVASKLQTSLNNMHSQLKIEIMSYVAKDNKIKTLEDLIIKLGYDLVMPRHARR